MGRVSCTSWPVSFLLFALSPGVLGLAVPCCPGLLQKGWGLRGQRDSPQLLPNASLKNQPRFLPTPSIPVTCLGLYFMAMCPCVWLQGLLPVLLEHSTRCLPRGSPKPGGVVPPLCFTREMLLQ